MTLSFRSHVLNTLACLAVLFCFGANASHALAQKTETWLSKRPPVVKIFDPDKDESTVKALLFDPQPGAFPMLGGPNSLPPPSMQLNSVEFTHAGIGPSRPQAVTFVIAPLEKLKTAPNFSVAVEGTVIHEGQATLSELCCGTVNGHSHNPQQIIISVPTEIFERMAQAKKIELKLSSKTGNYSIKLKDHQKKCLVAIASTMK